MTEQYSSICGGPEWWSLLDGASHFHKTAPCLWDAASSSTSAALSGRETPPAEGGQEAPHDSSDDANEDYESVLLSLGIELASLEQADAAEQHGEQRASDPSLAWPVPGQRQNTPVVSTDSSGNFGRPQPRGGRGPWTL